VELAHYVDFLFVVIDNELIVRSKHTTDLARSLNNHFNEWFMAAVGAKESMIAAKQVKSRNLLSSSIGD